MRLRASLGVLAGACVAACSGQSGFRVLSAAPATEVSLRHAFGAYTEIPPWSDTGRLQLSSSSTWSCPVPTRWIEAGATLSLADCRLETSPAIQAPDAGYLDPAAVSGQDWRRNYDGVYSAHAAGGRTLLLRHGENKNESLGGFDYQNTINTDVPVSQCRSGPGPSGYEDCAPAYNAFVTLTELDSSGVATDRGPIIWPSDGYVDATGSKRSQGVMQATGIADGDFLYVYYVDTSDSDEPGRSYGLKVARARLDELRFSCWYQGDFSQPCLPEAFTADRTVAFAPVQGPRADVILRAGEPATPIRFTVARAGSGRLIAIEETVLADRTAIFLWTSTDFVHWSNPLELSALTTPGDWSAGVFHYPILVSRDGARNTDVDPSAFTALGTRDLAADAARIMAVELSVGF